MKQVTHFDSEYGKIEEPTLTIQPKHDETTNNAPILFPSLLRFAVAVAVIATLIGWTIGSVQIQYNDQANKLLARNALSLEAFDSGTVSFFPTPSQQ